MLWLLMIMIIFTYTYYDTSYITRRRGRVMMIVSNETNNLHIQQAHTHHMVHPLHTNFCRAEHDDWEYLAS